MRAPNSFTHLNTDQFSEDARDHVFEQFLQIHRLYGEKKGVQFGRRILRLFVIRMALMCECTLLLPFLNRLTNSSQLIF